MHVFWCFFLHTHGIESSLEALRNIYLVSMLILIFKAVTSET